MSKAPTRNEFALLLLAAAFLLLFVFKGLAAAPPSKASGGEFNADRAYQRLERVLGDQRPHPVDSAANDAVRDRLVAEIRAIGFEPQIGDDFACRGSAARAYVSCARVRNVLFVAGPQTGQAILVTSHYDSVPAGPGASDDGAGMAAALEIASILKARSPTKPVIFLFTDGEEAGLIGAHSFVRKDPLARKVFAVVNMEARGVTGPAILFETGDPNEREIAAFAKRAQRPVGNSLATDIYKQMPNDTDMSEYLAPKSDALNFAFMDGLPFYHTPNDNLQNLDRRSLAHIGAAALSALDGFLRDVDVAAKPKESQLVFADLFSHAMILVRQPVGLAFILMGLVASLAAFLGTGGGAPVRAMVAPVVGIAAAMLSAFVAISLVGAIKPAANFWYAAPNATRAVIYAAAIAGAVAGLALGAPARRPRLVAAAWFWFCVLGVIAYLAMPGSALLFGAPAALFACAAAGSAGAPRLLAPISLGAIAAALMMWLPVMHHAELGLGLGAAWPFAGLAALLFLLAAPIAMGESGAMRLAAILAPSGALVAAIMLAATAPSYSPAAPRPLNVQMIDDPGENAAYIALAPGGEAPPPEMAAAGAFSEQELNGLPGKRYMRSAAPAGDAGPVVSVTRGATQNQFGAVIDAQGADEIIVLAPAAAGVRAITAAGETFAMKGEGAVTVRCIGRACASFAYTAETGDVAPEWTALGLRYGLANSEAAAVASLREASATPIQNGDVRIVVTRFAPTPIGSAR